MGTVSKRATVRKPKSKVVEIRETRPDSATISATLVTLVVLVVLVTLVVLVVLVVLVAEIFSVHPEIFSD